MKDLNEYIHESLESVNEAMNEKKAKDIIKNIYDEDGEAVSIASCWNWLNDLNWKKMSERDYIREIPKINDDIDSDMVIDRYAPVMMAMVALGKEATYEYLKSFVDEDELDDYEIKK